jgi:hypothetical protein
MKHCVRGTAGPFGRLWRFVWCPLFPMPSSAVPDASAARLRPSPIVPKGAVCPVCCAPATASLDEPTTNPIGVTAGWVKAGIVCSCSKHEAEDNALVVLVSGEACRDRCSLKAGAGHGL